MTDASSERAAACPYCDGPIAKTSRDHIMPRVFGNLGAHNLIACCHSCNQVKGNLTPAALRALAKDLETRAAFLCQMAARVDALIAERGLWKDPQDHLARRGG